LPKRRNWSQTAGFVVASVHSARAFINFALLSVAAHPLIVPYLNVFY